MFFPVGALSANCSPLDCPFGMNAFDSPGYGDYRPLFYVRGHGVHLTTLLVGVYAVALVACSLLMAAGQERGVLSLLAFDSSAVVQRWEVWRLVTYPLLQPPSLWFLLEMYFLYTFGQEVEKFFGRRTFLKLYAAMLLVPTLLLTAGDFFGVRSVLVGTNTLHFGVFALFVFVYPGVRFALIPLTALQWLLVLLAFYTLICLAGRDWTAVFTLWVSVGVAFLGVRVAGAGGGWPSSSFVARVRNLFPRRRGNGGRASTTVRGGTFGKQAPQARSSSRRAVEAPVSGGSAAVGGGAAGSVKTTGGSGGLSGRGDVYDSIDPLLDKIAKHGLGSLSASERAALERARASLLRKDRKD